MISILDQDSDICYGGLVPVRHGAAYYDLTHQRGHRADKHPQRSGGSSQPTAARREMVRAFHVKLVDSMVEGHPQAVLCLEAFLIIDATHPTRRTRSHRLGYQATLPMLKLGSQVP